MRVTVDTTDCDGAGGCTSVCPQVFAIDDDDKVFVLDEYPEPSVRDCVRMAQKICPRGVITIEY